MADDTLIGKVIDNYRILELVGTGVTSLVFKVVNINAKEWIRAIKLLEKSLAADKNFHSALNREIRVLGNFIEELHFYEHIIMPYEFGKIGNTGTAYDGMPYILMEFMDGGNLEQALDFMNLEQKTECMIQAILGLEAAHEKEILHLDFHTRNVLLDSKKGVKISDFGVGMVMSDPQISISGYRKPIRWPAPEQDPYAQLAGMKITEKTDVYQVGASLLFILTNHGPSTGERYIDQLDNGPPNTPKELKELIIKCLSKDPDQRPELNDVRKKLEELLPILDQDREYSLLVSRAVKELAKIGGINEISWKSSWETPIPIRPNVIRALYKARERHYNLIRTKGFKVPIEQVEAVISAIQKRDFSIIVDFSRQYVNSDLEIINKIPPEERKTRKEFLKISNTWHKYMGRLSEIDTSNWSILYPLPVQLEET